MWLRFDAGEQALNVATINLPIEGCFFEYGFIDSKPILELFRKSMIYVCGAFFVDDEIMCEFSRSRSSDFVF